MSASATSASAETVSLQGYAERVAECNVGAEGASDLVPLVIDSEAVGYLKSDFVDRLVQLGPETFASEPCGRITLSPTLTTLEARTQAVESVLLQLRDQGVIPGWRDERYPVAGSFGVPPVLLLERAAAAFFGIKSYGVHINGYVRRADGGLDLWVARRSASKPTWPLKLDHIVAGGQPAGLGCRENVLKECWEEAGIPAEMAEAAVAAGAVSYSTMNEAGLKRDVLFVYDLELPESFQPVPQDGEVEEFMLWPIEKVMDVVRTTDDYKTNCNLVIIDFLIRRGYITPEQPGYLSLVASMRSGDCS